MEQFFNRAWHRQARWLWLLLPLAWLYGLVTWLNKRLYALGLKPIYYPTLPTIVIGNITVGGSGKTPLMIALVCYLQKRGIRVGVISRGYGGDTQQMPCIVTPTSTPQQVGDEPCLIVQETGVAMAVAPNRGAAIERLIQHYPDTQILLADDGLQHYALDRDLDWIVVDGDRGFGNQQLLPVGFLREPIKRLNSPNTTVIYHQQHWKIADTRSSANDALFMRLNEAPIEPLFKQFSKTIAEHLTADNAPNIIAMTGIGYPQRFFNSLSKLYFTLIEKPFNDHHQYTLQDFDNLPDLPIVITSKDAVKVRLLFNDMTDLEQQRLAAQIWVLPVKAELSANVFARLDEQLKSLGIKF